MVVHTDVDIGARHVDKLQDGDLYGVVMYRQLTFENLPNWVPTTHKLSYLYTS